MLTRKERRQIVLNAAKQIFEGNGVVYCCCAIPYCSKNMERDTGTLREDFAELFRREWQHGGERFFGPVNEKNTNYRVTALLLFREMQ